MAEKAMSFRCSEDEMQAWKSAAEFEALPLATWAKRTLTLEARRIAKEQGESAILSEEMTRAILRTVDDRVDLRIHREISDTQ